MKKMYLLLVVVMVLSLAAGAVGWPIMQQTIADAKLAKLMETDPRYAVAEAVEAQCSWAFALNVTYKAYDILDQDGRQLTAVQVYIWLDKEVLSSLSDREVDDEISALNKATIEAVTTEWPDITAIAIWYLDLVPVETFSGISQVGRAFWGISGPANVMAEWAAGGADWDSMVTSVEAGTMDVYVGGWMPTKYLYSVLERPSYVPVPWDDEDNCTH